MTPEEAKKNQERLSRSYSIGYWYGTRCEKCCGVYPKLITGRGTKDLCFYECEVCGKRTRPCLMPWESEKEWNEGRIIHGTRQLQLF